MRTDDADAEEFTAAHLPSGADRVVKGKHGLSRERFAGRWAATFMPGIALS